MDIFWEELTAGMPTARQLAQIIIRLLAATLLGAAIGIQRERVGKPAGLRTHTLVTLGTCVFVIAGGAYGMSSDGLSRVIQGIVTGIGFIGAGSILKLNEERDIQGLTTAAGVWMASAIGVAVGLGALGLAILATILTLIILTLVGRIEFQINKRQLSEGKPTTTSQTGVNDDE
ncbi:MAG: MgtC/SapB family protein [Acidobacteriota bacterium]|nr:MgtC/SapB family protein [Acidobacteriota bacterium]